MIAGFERRPGLADQPLLDHRHLGQRQLDPEVAAGDHDPAARRVDDLLGVLGRLPLLDLGDQRDVGAERAQPLGDRLEVGGGRDEGDREQVDAVLDRELDPAQVAVGRGAARSRRGCSSPCARRASRPPRPRSRRRPSSGSSHAQADRAVGEVDELVLAQRGDAGPGDRDRLARRPRRRCGVSFTCIPVSSSATSSRSSPIRSFGPGRSPSTATSRPTRSAAARIDSIVPRVALAVGVGEVEAEDVDAGLDQALEDGRRPSSPGRPWR